jgi:TatD DNase family protein
MMRLFDTHAHLLSERFDADREVLISELPSRGLAGCIEVGTDLEFSDRAQRLAEQTDYIWAAVGVHPHDSADAPEDYIERLMEIAARPKVVAIGEIGLDYHYDFSPRDVQRRVFGRQLELARRLDLPVIIHMREATQDTLAMLREHKGIKGVMHCFSGSAETAEICVGMGLYVSFTGSVTFKNARKVVEAAAAVPPERLMAETDCPYLSPEPVRGRRNEPSNVRYVLEKLAEIKGVPADEMAEINIRNARELFGIE